MEWSGKHGPDPNARLKDWYPPVVGDLPLPLARAICKRANCWWDAELRRRIPHVAVAVMVVIFAISTVSGIIGHFQVE